MKMALMIMNNYSAGDGGNDDDQDDVTDDGADGR